MGTNALHSSTSNALMYIIHGVKTNLITNIYIAKILYMTCNPLICTILFDLSESSKIIVFKDFIMEIIEIKVTEKSKKKRDFGLNYLSD